LQFFFVKKILALKMARQKLEPPEQMPFILLGAGAIYFGAGWESASFLYGFSNQV
jgi:hypothetical protein